MRVVALVLLVACGSGPTPAEPAPTLLPAWLAPPNAPPLHVAGHVGGAPGGATVVLRNRWMVVAETRTDATGAFDFAWVPAETYWISASAPGFIADATEATAATELTLAPCGPAAIEGRVLTEDEQPIAGATVSYRLAPSTVTDANGRYSVCVPELRERDVRGETLLFTAPGRGSIESTVAVDGIARLDVILVPAVPVEGRVVGPDGKPLSLALVVANHRSGTDSGPADAVALTDRDGHFRLPALSESTLGLRALAPGARTAEPVQVEVPPAGRRDILIPTVATITVRGRATLYRGRPVANQDISLMAGDGDLAEWHWGHTDATGAFEIRAVPIGKARPFVEGYQIFDDVDVRPNMPPTNVIAEERTHGGSGRLTGIVTRHGKPVANAWICCGDATAGSSGTTSGPDGRYVLEELTDLWWHLSATTAEAHSARVRNPHGRSPHDDYVDSDEDHALPSEMDFELTYGAAVHGVLVDHIGQRVPGYRIKLRGEHLDTSVIADARGEFHVRSLEAGRYLVRVALLDDSQTFTGSGGSVLPAIEVPSNDAVVRDVSITIHDDRRTAPLAGRVVDPQGTPVAGARVRVINRRRGHWFEDMYTWLVLPSTVTSADGTFTFAALEPGPHSLQVRKGTLAVCVMKVEENAPALRIVLEGLTTRCASP